MSVCCPPGEGPPGASSTPSFGETSTPSGKVVTINNDGASAEAIPPMPCYVTGAPLPSSTLRRVVLVFTDVFGYDAGNHRAFADAVAARLGPAGTTAVLMPDFFRGNPIAQPASFLPAFAGMLATLPAFFYRIKFNQPPEVIERDLSRLLFPWIRTQVPTIEEIGVSCVGFCFGGWVTARALALRDLPIMCGVGIHPSFLVEGVHWGSEDELVKSIGAKPILLLPARNDSSSIKVGGRHVRALALARDVPEGTISVEFPAMKHGWVSRGDGTDPAAKCQEEALKEVVQFLHKHH